MAEGSIFKRCNCRDSAGRKLGPRCPRLRRPGGAWNPTHGRWGYQLELPTRPGQRRRQLRRTTFDSRDAACADRDHAKALLDLAGDDPELAADIADLLLTVPCGRRLPDRDAIARRVRAGLPATAAMTVADYLTQWLASRRAIEPTTVRSYESHIRVHLAPHLGTIRLDHLRVDHIEAMFTAIAGRTTAISSTRHPAPRQPRRARGRHRRPGHRAGHHAPHPRHPA